REEERERRREEDPHHERVDTGTRCGHGDQRSGIRREVGSRPVRCDIDEVDDPRLADYVALRDATLRRGLEHAGGLFIAEGEKIIRRAAEAGARPRSFLLQERWLAGLADVLEAHPDVPCYVASAQLVESVSGF